MQSWTPYEWHMFMFEPHLISLTTSWATLRFLTPRITLAPLPAWTCVIRSEDIITSILLPVSHKWFCQPTCWPARAAAVSIPIPDVAPVTRAVLPSRSISKCKSGTGLTVETCNHGYLCVFKYDSLKWQMTVLSKAGYTEKKQHKPFDMN